MKARVILAITLLSVLVLSMPSCKNKPLEVKIPQTKQEIAEDTIKIWMIRSNEYPHYKPIVFGDLTPHYYKSSSTLQLSIQIADEIEASNLSEDKHTLDSLYAEIAKYKGDFLGYLIPHKFQETNIAGETINCELLFFLDTTLRITSALPPESFDYILDERVFFRPDSAFSK